MSSNDTIIPPGLCQCGCGGETKRYSQSVTKRGEVKGEFRRFLPGHNAFKYKTAESPNPSGLCMCGCGEKTRIAATSSARDHQIAGQPMRYIKGHNGSLSPIQYTVEDHGHETPCWIWQRNTIKGYGYLFDNGKTRKAHRVFYERAKGPIPPGYEIDHVVCQNTRCVNPDHLEAVTPTVNNRRRKGWVKLTEEKAAEIRSLVGTVPTAMLAERFGISKTHVLRVAKGEGWN